jgi:hypothetical protein
LPTDYLALFLPLSNLQHCRLNRACGIVGKPLEQQWARGSAQQRLAYGRDGMRAFVAAPGKQQINYRQSSGANVKPAA